MIIDGACYVAEVEYIVEFGIPDCHRILAGLSELKIRSQDMESI